ncbi:hypothetical protein K8I61_07025 [bacterium]|nr:hypothetical protein [bacterium]
MLAFAGAAGATSLLRLSTEHVLKTATTVVAGEVVATAARHRDKAPQIVTDVALRIDISFKSAPDQTKAKTVTFTVPGGFDGKKGLAVSAAPVFKTGDRVLVALEGDGVIGEKRVVGFNQGRFAIVTGEAGRVLYVRDPLRTLADNEDLAAAVERRPAEDKLTTDDVRRLAAGDKP